MTKALRRALVAVPVLLVAAYALLVWYVWLNENSGVYPGADLSAVSQLTVNGVIPAPWDTLRVATEDGIGALRPTGPLPIFRIEREFRGLGTHELIAFVHICAGRYSRRS